MNYLEYSVEFTITEETEKKTREIMDLIKEGRCAFNFIKFIDEDIGDDKKKINTLLSDIINNLNDKYNESMKNIFDNLFILCIDSGSVYIFYQDFV
jgi:hypothetical protein